MTSKVAFKFQPDALLMIEDYRPRVKARKQDMSVLSTQVSQSSAHDDPKKTPVNGAVPEVSPTERIDNPKVETAIVFAASPSAGEQNPPPVVCSLATDLQMPGKDEYDGVKFDSIPSAWMFRTGTEYMQCIVPMPRIKVVEEENLYLNNKDKNREKNVTDAVGRTKNSLHGKVEKAGEPLTEIKMEECERLFQCKLDVSAENNEDSIELKEPGVKKPGIDAETNQVNKNGFDEFTFKNKIIDIPVRNPEDSLTASVSPEVINIEDEKTKDQESASVFPGICLESKELDANLVVIEESPILTTDILGLFTLKLTLPIGSDAAFMAEFEEDISWFETPVSITSVVETTNRVIEVKMRERGMALAALHGLKQKYPGLEGETGEFYTDIVPDKKTGLYTLCFTDSRLMKYKATFDKFKMYSKQPPLISKGIGKEQVLVGFVDKNSAVEALRDNIDSFEFPNLRIAPDSRILSLH